MKVLLEYDWPGNVRELENLISVACALRDEDKLSLDNIPPNYGIKRLANKNSESINDNLADISSTINHSISIDENKLIYQAYTAVGTLYDQVTIIKDFESGKKVLQ